MYSRMWALCVIGVSILSVGCSSDDGGTTGPNQGTTQNAVATGFGALADAYDAVITANAPMYASAAYFAPFIAASFTGPTPLRGDLPVDQVAPAVSCLPLGAEDVVFRYDTNVGQYVATTESGAPPGGARYILYQVDITGTPTVPLVETGYFDITCTETADTLQASVNNSSGVAIMDVVLYWFYVNPPDYIVTSSPGELSDPDGNITLGILFSAEGTVNQYVSTRLTVGAGLELFDSRAYGFEAHAGLDGTSFDPGGLPQPPYYSFGAGATQENPSQTLLWNASATMSVADDGTLRNYVGGLVAPLELEDHEKSTNGILACFSGDYLNATVQGSSANCATGVIDTPIALSQGDLNAIEEGYSALIDMLESMSTMLVVSIAAVMN